MSNVNVERLQGGNVLRINTGGSIDIAGGSFTLNSTQLAAVADSTGTAAADTVLNTLLARLRSIGLLST